MKVQSMIFFSGRGEELYRRAGGGGFMTSDESKSFVPQPPKPGLKDKIYHLGKIAVAAGSSMLGLSVVGGTANEVIEMVFGSPFQRKQMKWCGDVAETLEYLVNRRGVSIEELQEDEEFISFVATTAQIAMRTHQEEKREALRNALLNSVISVTLDDSLKFQFLHYIDTLTVWHIRMLKTFSDPRTRTEEELSKYGAINASPFRVLEVDFPELKGKRDFVDPFWKDLFIRGLVGIESLHGMMTREGGVAKRTTVLGDEFIKFIRQPDELNDEEKPLRV
ncbi:MAG: hypothetical protein NUW37_00290 [Planctomycetes bacterium]|nr:hypothetical protein [Planctomycetota bacterium]